MQKSIIIIQSGFMGEVQPRHAAGWERALGCRMLMPEIIQISGLPLDIYFLSVLFSEVNIHPRK